MTHTSNALEPEIIEPEIIDGPGGIHLAVTGTGDPVVFVHGGGAGGPSAWGPQLALADRYRLIMPWRLGYAPNPPVAVEDFERDATIVAALLGGGVHLVAHSYGGVVALLAAAARPDEVRSLTLIEPGASSVARDVPVVADFERRLRAVIAAPPIDPRAFLSQIFDVLDPGHELPSPLPPPLVALADRMRTGLRWPHDAHIPLAELATAGLPVLTVSGGTSLAFGAIAERLATELGGRHVTIPGAGHAPHLTAPDVFNAELELNLEAGRALRGAPG